jgi:orotate phosphoribosyltransferase
MTDVNAAALLELVVGRRGHFRLESGYHSSLWFDVDAMFANPQRIAPFVRYLAEALRPHAVSAVCGPLVGGAFLAQFLAHALGAEFYFTKRVSAPDTAGMLRARYELPGPFAMRVRGRRIAIVDDVMSAGSALRGTHKALLTRGAVPVVAGALLVLGSTGCQFFAEQQVPVEAAARQDFDLWVPSECPLCRTSLPLEVVTD